MSATALPQDPAPSKLGAVPPAIWGVVGALALATAGLGGALLMRSAESGKAPVVQAPPTAQVASLQAPAATAGSATTAVQPQSAPAAPAAAVAQPAPKPVPKPRPAQQVAQAQPQSASQGEYRPAPMPIESTRAAVCASCGRVEAVHAVQQKGEGSGIGAVGGAVLGGVLGNQVGGGNGKTAMTVLGALGGGLAGNEVEKRYKASTVYDVQVRMEDGSLRTFRRSDAVAVGTRVTVEGSTFQVGGNVSEGSSAPRTLRTSGSGTCRAGSLPSPR